MKVLLIDGDRMLNHRHLFPNLALMKLSAWHKANSDEILPVNFLLQSNIDRAYLSMVFPCERIWSLVLTDIYRYGGSGFDNWEWLPEEIEHTCPDYSLYDCNYAMGFTSRGCPRSCAFCIVPKKEGKWRATASIYEFWRGQERLRLLDNNLTANENHCVDVLGQILKEGIQVDFSQGLDIRFLTSRVASLLAQVRLWKQIHFAWDQIGDESKVRKGIALLEQAMPLSRVMFYVLIGFDSSPEEDLYRVETLQGLGVDPFVMPYRKTQYTQRFARWVNHKAIFKTVKWEDYP